MDVDKDDFVQFEYVLFSDVLDILDEDGDESDDFVDEEECFIFGLFCVGV